MDSENTQPLPAEGVAETPFAQLPVEITVSVGRARISVADLLNLGPSAVLPLNRGIDEPVEVFVGDRLIARGILEELGPPNEGQIAVRMTEVAELSQGLKP